MGAYDHLLEALEPAAPEASSAPAGGQYDHLLAAVSDQPQAQPLAPAAAPAAKPAPDAPDDPPDEVGAFSKVVGALDYMGRYVRRSIREAVGPDFEYDPGDDAAFTQIIHAASQKLVPGSRSSVSRERPTEYRQREELPEGLALEAVEFAGGLGGSILADPLTYVGVGTLTKLGKAAQVATKGQRAARLTGRAYEIAANSEIGQILAKAAPEAGVLGKTAAEQARLGQRALLSVAGQTVIPGTAPGAELLFHGAGKLAGAISKAPGAVTAAKWMNRIFRTEFGLSDADKDINFIKRLSKKEFGYLAGQIVDDYGEARRLFNDAARRAGADVTEQNAKLLRLWEIDGPEGIKAAVAKGEISAEEGELLIGFTNRNAALLAEAQKAGIEVTALQSERNLTYVYHGRTKEALDWLATQPGMSMDEKARRFIDLLAKRPDFAKMRLVDMPIHEINEAAWEAGMPRTIKLMEDDPVVIMAARELAQARAVTSKQALDRITDALTVSAEATVGELRRAPRMLSKAHAQELLTSKTAYLKSQKEVWDRIHADPRTFMEGVASEMQAKDLLARARRIGKSGALAESLRSETMVTVAALRSLVEQAGIPSRGLGEIERLLASRATKAAKLGDPVKQVALDLRRHLGDMQRELSDTLGAMPSLRRGPEGRAIAARMAEVKTGAKALFAQLEGQISGLEQALVRVDDSTQAALRSLPREIAGPRLEALHRSIEQIAGLQRTQDVLRGMAERTGTTSGELREIEKNLARTEGKAARAQKTVNRALQLRPVLEEQAWEGARYAQEVFARVAPDLGDIAIQKALEQARGQFGRAVAPGRFRAIARVKDPIAVRYARAQEALKEAAAVPADYTVITEGALKGRAAPREVVEFVADMQRAVDDEKAGFSVFRSVYDPIQRYWASWSLTPRLSFHTRNFVGGVWNNFLAGDIEVRHYVRARSVMASSSDDLARMEFRTKAGQVVTYAEAREAGRRLGIDTGHASSEYTSARRLRDSIKAKAEATTVRGLINQSKGRALVPLMPGADENSNVWLKLGAAGGQAIEGELRWAHFLGKLEAGLSFEDAALSVKKYHFDYSELSDTERNVLKRIMPFYSWTRNNVPLQAQKLITDPAKFAAIGKARTEYEAQSSEIVPRALLPEWAQKAFAIQAGRDKHVAALYTLANYLPAQDLGKLFSPGELTEALVAMISPIIKHPVEQVSGIDFFRSAGQRRLVPIRGLEGGEGEWAYRPDFLGAVLNPRVVHFLKAHVAVNEIDKWNPGGIFGEGVSTEHPQGAPASVNLVPFADSAQVRQGYDPDSDPARAGKFLLGLKRYEADLRREVRQRTLQLNQNIAELRAARRQLRKRGDVRAGDEAQRKIEQLRSRRAAIRAAYSGYDR